MIENTPSLPQSPATTPQASLETQASQSAASTREKLPYGAGRRAGYGILWAAWTALLGIGGFASLFSGQILAGLIGLVLAAVAGHYDYRIWTWRARRLLFLIIW